MLPGVTIKHSLVGWCKTECIDAMFHPPSCLRATHMKVTGYDAELSSVLGLQLFFLSTVCTPCNQSIQKAPGTRNAYSDY